MDLIREGVFDSGLNLFWIFLSTVLLIIFTKKTFKCFKF